jgi:hypothetical protein
MFRLPTKPSSGVSKHRILKVAVTDPLLKLIKLTIYATDGHYDTPDDGLVGSRNM